MSSLIILSVISWRTLHSCYFWLSWCISWYLLVSCWTNTFNLSPAAHIAMECAPQGTWNWPGFTYVWPLNLLSCCPVLTWPLVKFNQIKFWHRYDCFEWILIRHSDYDLHTFQLWKFLGGGEIRQKNKMEKDWIFFLLKVDSLGWLQRGPLIE